MTTAQPIDLQSKFELLRSDLQGVLIERNTFIDTALLAVVSGLHHYQLGVPGVAKSFGVRQLVHRIGGLTGVDYFETLMTRFSAPEEVFGPFSLTKLKEDRFARNTAAMFPEAKFAFLDEVFKANSSILNALLTALNERVFRNDGVVNELPLWTMFCASNELPESEDLNALFDRIHFRTITKPVSELGNFIKMLKIEVKEPQIILDWSDVEEAARQAAQVEIPDEVLEALLQVRVNLAADGIMPTDRRFHESLKVIRAAAWLDRQTVAEIEHVRPLAHMLWETPDHAPRVERMLLELANPQDKEVMNLLEIIQGVNDELVKLLSDKEVDATTKARTGIELHNKVDRIADDLAKLKTTISKSPRKSAKIEEATQLLTAVTERLLKEIFDLEIDAKP